jgi:hypothetical protein
MQTSTAKVFKNQPLSLSLDTKTALASATTTRIAYKKPNAERTEGTFAASKDTTTMTASIEKDLLNVAGTWHFQAEAEFGAGSGFYRGQTAKVTILENFED